MRKSVPFIFFFLLTLMIASCSDSDVVAGTFHGKMYSTDTVDANVKVTAINDGIIRLDITGPTINGGYVEYAQLKKDADNAYAMKWSSGDTLSSTIELSGYYFEGYMSYDAWTHQYKFSGQKE
jgi:hypothetical protein